MKEALIALLALVLFASFASADIEPPQCSVSPADALGGVVCCPNLSSPLTESINTITIRSPGGTPLVGVNTVVLLTAANPACPGAVLTGITNDSGVVTITVAAKGCANIAPSACVIKGNGVTLRTYSRCKSPDFDGSAGDGVVNLADLIAFANEFNLITVPGCHDYTNDDMTNLSDLIVFGSAFSTAKHCP